MSQQPGFQPPGLWRLLAIKAASLQLRRSDPQDSKGNGTYENAFYEI